MPCEPKTDTSDQKTPPRHLHLTPDYRRILGVLGECDGSTSGRIASELGNVNLRSESQIIRFKLLDLEKAGYVSRLDDQKPVLWRRTPAGTEALNHV